MGKIKNFVNIMGETYKNFRFGVMAAKGLNYPYAAGYKNIIFHNFHNFQYYMIERYLCKIIRK